MYSSGGPKARPSKVEFGPCSERRIPTVSLSQDDHVVTPINRSWRHEAWPGASGRVLAYPGGAAAAKASPLPSGAETSRSTLRLLSVSACGRAGHGLTGDPWPSSVGLVMLVGVVGIRFRGRPAAQATGPGEGGAARGGGPGGRRPVAQAGQELRQHPVQRAERDQRRKRARPCGRVHVLDRVNGVTRRRRSWPTAISSSTDDGGLAEGGRCYQRCAQVAVQDGLGDHRPADLLSRPGQAAVHRGCSQASVRAGNIVVRDLDPRDASAPARARSSGRLMPRRVLGARRLPGPAPGRACAAPPWHHGSASPTAAERPRPAPYASASPPSDPPRPERRQSTIATRLRKHLASHADRKPGPLV